MADGNQALLRSFDRALRIANRSPRPRQSYIESATLLAVFLSDKPYENVTRNDVAEFLADQLDRHKPASAAVR